MRQVGLMNKDREELIKKMKELKEKLEYLIANRNEIDDPDIIKTSQMLDEVLNKLSKMF